MKLASGAVAGTPADRSRAGGEDAAGAELAADPSIPAAIHGCKGDASDQSAQR